MNFDFESMSAVELFHLKKAIEKEINNRKKAKYAMLFTKVVNAIDDIVMYPDFENVPAIETETRFITWETLKEDLISYFQKRHNAE